MASNEPASSRATAREWATRSNALLHQRQFAEAEATARRGLEQHPRDASLLLNLGAALHQQGRIEDAIASYQAAAEIAPNAAIIYSNLADALARAARLADAEAAARRAIALEPRSSVHWSNLSTVLLRQGRFEEGLTAARQAIAFDPTDDWAHGNVAVALLSMGRMDAEAWGEYEHRPNARMLANPARRIWDGSPLKGDAIVLREEQGFGDTIMFVRYAALLRERAGAGRVIVECRPVLKALLKIATGVDEVAAWGEPSVDAAWEVPMMSLPHRFSATLSTIPTRVPYLQSDAARVGRARAALASKKAFNVGIAWAGNPNHANDRLRSCPLDALAPLAMDGVRLVSLQKGPAAERDAAVMSKLGVVDLARDCNDFADLAALISALDLIITVDTAPAHLAGALARPTWLLLPHVAEWRWMSDREDSPWYPTMRLFRQSAFGDWSSVAQRVAAELRRRADDRLKSAHP